MRGKPKASPGPGTHRHRTPLAAGCCAPNSLRQTQSRGSPGQNKAVPGQGRGPRRSRAVGQRLWAGGRGWSRVRAPGSGSGGAVCATPRLTRRVGPALARDRGSLVPKSASESRQGIKARARFLLTAQRWGKRCRAQHSAGQRTAVNLQQPWKKSKLKLNLFKLG